MANRLHVGTRKGLFELAPKNGGWDIVDTHFLGDPVTAILADGEKLYVALDLGHFGAHLWQRDGTGGTLQMKTKTSVSHQQRVRKRNRLGL